MIASAAVREAARRTFKSSGTDAAGGFMHYSEHATAVGSLRIVPVGTMIAIPLRG
jgi:hypothetical protein